MDNDFKNIGKKMPYTTPEGFFQQMEEQLLAQAPAPKARPRRPWIIATSCTIAASLAIGAILWTTISKPDQDAIETQPLYTWNDKLSDKEAEAIYQLIENDTFLNEDINLYLETE